jgi:GNAT superfamily N-acetyltransferase
LAFASKFSGKGVGSEVLDFIRMWFLDESNKTGCRFAIVDAKNESEVLLFYEHNGFKALFSREIDEDLYTKPAKDEAERAERIKNPRKLRTRLMFCDLLDD